MGLGDGAPALNGDTEGQKTEEKKREEENKNRRKKPVSITWPGGTVHRIALFYCVITLILSQQSLQLTVSDPIIKSTINFTSKSTITLYSTLPSIIYARALRLYYTQSITNT